MGVVGNGQGTPSAPGPRAGRVEAALARLGAERDRFADFLRVLAIALVVVGHWLAVVILVVDGRLVAGRILALVPWTQWGTWAFQVMPVFFIVGGFANAGSWRRAAARGEAWAAWVRRRAWRLLRPLLPLVVAWPLLSLLLVRAGLPGDTVQLASQAAVIPVWFLGVYLLVIALVPLTWRLHERWGLAVPAALVALAAGVDALARAGVPLIAFANTGIVWAAIHQAGYFWYEQRLPERAAVGFGFLVLGLAALVLLVTLGGYPVSMVAVEAGERSNASPPTVALIALALAQLGLILLARRPVDRWLARPRAWRVVAVAGSVTLTVYLWHMTALTLVGTLTFLSGLWPASSTVDARWWALRPAWLALCAVVLLGLVLLFARFEGRGAPAPEGVRMRTLFGLLATLVGVALLVRRGLYDPAAPAGIPVLTLALLLAGFAALGVLWSPRRSRIRGGARRGRARGPAGGQGQG